MMVTANDVPRAVNGAGAARELGYALLERAGEISDRLAAAWRADRGRAGGAAPTVEADIRNLAVEGVSRVARYLTTGGPQEDGAGPTRPRSWAAMGVVTLACVAKLHMVWRDAFRDVARREAEQLGTAPDVVDLCLWAIDLAYDVSVVRMARRFEVTRHQLEHQLSEHRAQLEHQALHDPLTGLANRALLMDRLDRAIQGTGRHHGRPVVLFFDLDDFKAVNDGAGHAVGDKLLVEVATRLRGAVRSSDTIARLGGDEFVVLCEDLPDALREGVALAERIARALREPFDVGGHELRLAASIGVAMANSDDRAGSLLSRADQAMYQAKELGRDRIEVYVPAMDQQATRRAEVSTALHRAVGDGQLDVVYQAVVGLPGHRLVDREALLRWHHPGLGNVPPAEFIPVAEDNGLITEVGSWVLRRACEDCMAWRGREDAAPGVTVNVAARQLHELRFADTVADVLERSRLDAAALTLEVTEAVLMGERVDARALLERLRAVGVRIAIDDFGTGSSSLSWLARLPLDLVKIDRTFIGALGNSDRAPAIVEAMVHLAHTLGLAVVAKGVETESQLEWLTSVGCDAVQGYLVGHPERAITD